MRIIFIITVITILAGCSKCVNIEIEVGKVCNSVNVDNQKISRPVHVYFLLCNQYITVDEAKLQDDYEAQNKSVRNIYKKVLSKNEKTTFCFLNEENKTKILVFAAFNKKVGKQEEILELEKFENVWGVPTLSLRINDKTIELKK